MAKVAHILIGLPASGKSTWVKDFNAGGAVVISSDDIIESICQQYGITYNDGFKNLIQFAEEQAQRTFDDAVERELDVIIDRTNMSAKSRKRWLQPLVDAGYWIVGVVFTKPDDTEWQRRLDSRMGKTIPPFVLKSMEDNYDAPSKLEGFDTIQTRSQ